MARKGYVRYDAPTQFNTRTLTKQDWLSQGVTDMETVHWGPENNYKVPASKFSHDAWPFIEAESSLIYEKGDDDEQRDEVPESEARSAPETGTKRGRR